MQAYLVSVGDLLTQNFLFQNFNCFPPSLRGIFLMDYFNCFNRRMTWSFLRHQKISIIATWLQWITNLQLVFSRQIENTQKKYLLCVVAEISQLFLPCPSRMIFVTRGNSQIVVSTTEPVTNWARSNSNMNFRLKLNQPKKIGTP